MNGNVPYQEDVRPGELRHAMRGYNALGYPPAGYVPASNGMVTIIIMAPPATTLPDWRAGAWNSPPAARRGATWFDWRRYVRLLCVVAIIVAIGYIGYSAAFGGGARTISGAATETGGMRLDPKTGRMAELTPLERAQQAASDLRREFARLLPQSQPAQPQATPAPWWRFWNWEPDKAQPQAQVTGWTWPPKNPVGDAIDTAAQFAVWVAGLAIVLSVLWIVAFVPGILRRR